MTLYLSIFIYLMNCYSAGTIGIELLGTIFLHDDG